MEGKTILADTEGFKAIHTPELLRLSSVFTKHGYELRIVGGAVRDLLMGKLPKDIDLCTNATPEQMIKMFKDEEIRCIETGLQHGTLTAHINKTDFEVTTLRIDVETDGRHAKVKFTNDWQLDAERRDLTFNAMSVDLTGNLYDYFNGEIDLRKGHVRFVGDARLRIKEDYLRILRYFRFYGKIATEPDNHDPDTLAVIKELAEGLRIISVERIWLEVSKILIGNHAQHLLQMLYDLGIASNIGLPTYDASCMTEFHRAWKESQIFSLQPVTLLCCLVNTACEAEILARHWKLSNAERNLGKFITEHRLPKEHETPLKPYQDMLVVSPSAQSKETLRGHITELLHYQGRHELGEAIACWIIPSFPVTGDHLKSIGLKPGPEFGRTLSQLKQMWRESYYVATKEDLLEKAHHMIKR
ncbi:predicted protein [Nematostella vectensis]|uniref:CCA tRNA nucleotidyltransferase 1, mitochondrial n=1 Tax=Nematostella vectensis TaxID=45351 RepID=A7RRV1_NEMVE|nr:predicted protein [Nematostella vectensis]|eukprot:XP_001637889.1 predicted protein [Nematostella vectensis]